MTPRTPFTAIAIVLLLITASASADCIDAYIQRDVIGVLVKAQTVRELVRIKRHVPLRNNVSRGVYWLRRNEVAPTALTEAELLKTVPTSDIDLSLLYRLTYQDLVPPARPELFSEYLEAVYKIVRKSRTRYPILLKLGTLAQGGDLGEAIESFISRLYEDDPRGVSAALAAMPAAQRTLVCGEEAIPCPKKSVRHKR